MKRMIVAALMGVGCLACAGAASAGCELRQVAEYTTASNFLSPVIEVKINGHAAKLMIDSGADRTTIFRTKAEALGVIAHYNRNSEMFGVGGSEHADAADIQDLDIGAGAIAHRVHVLVVGRGFSDVDGILGEDFLSHFDMELDLQAHKVRLFRPQGCPPNEMGDRVVYWNKPYSVTPIMPTNFEEDVLAITVVLNGRKELAMLDTGSGGSVVTDAAAEEAHVTPTRENLHAGTTEGMSGATVATSVAVFPTFTVGDETVKNAKLEIADLWDKDRTVSLGSRIADKLQDLPQMLLGADFIRAHRMYIARSQGKVYFSYVGGPIFDLTQHPRAHAPAAPKPDAATAPAPSPPKP